MDDEEESMELSGGESQCVSNLASNLHNFSFDVSWYEKAQAISPPLNRRRTLATPSRLEHARPGSTSLVQEPDIFSTSLTLPSRYKKDHLKFSTPTVKVSQKTVETYHASDRSSRGHSPMELDQSGDNDAASVVSIAPSILSTFSRATSYTSKTAPTTDIEIDHTKWLQAPDWDGKSTIIDSSIVSSTPVRHRNVNNNIPTEPSTPLDDSVFYNKGQTPLDAKFQKKSAYRQMDKNISNDASEKVSIIVILFVLLMFICMGGYLFMQIGSCALFDIDVVQLKQRVEDNVFGQHIAVSVVLQALQRFQRDVKSGQPQRTLVFSFHGWTGVGKNYMSKFVSESFYNAKVHTFLVPLQFPSIATSEEDLLGEKQKMKRAILGNVTKCGVNVFIFDEMDKSDQSFLQAVQEAIIKLKETPARVNDQTAQSSPVTVFLFLSNSLSSQINHCLFSQLLKDRPREAISHSEFRNVFTKESHEWYEGLKKNGLIDYYVPFLPLAESHVRQCIVNEFVKRGHNPSDDLVQKVMEELSFFEMGGTEGQISLTGCKRVQDKVDLHMDDG